MTRKSYNYLLNQLRECQLENGALSTDEEYNILTYKALPFRLRREAESARFVVVAQVHSADKGAIRRAVNIRAPQVLVRARWNTKDEIVFVLSDAPVEFCARLAVAFKNENVTASIAHTSYSGNIHQDVDRATQSLPTHVYST